MHAFTCLYQKICCLVELQKVNVILRFTLVSDIAGPQLPVSSSYIYTWCLFGPDIKRFDILVTHFVLL